jgi:regulator of cell morphogenesis and NO signaling
MIHVQQTVGELAALSPSAVRVFESYGIDFCCGGNQPLDVACRDKELAPEQVLGELEAALDEPGAPGEDWNTAPLSALIDHILSRHHAYLRSELPRLFRWLRAVQEAHGAGDGVVLAALEQVLAGLQQELEAHMHKEELILFPAIRRADAGIGQPIAVMETEHESASRALREIRRLTADYQPPERACATYRALWQALAELEKDLHLHIHLENNILFPRALREAG